MIALCAGGASTFGLDMRFLVCTNKDGFAAASYRQACRCNSHTVTVHSVSIMLLYERTMQSKLGQLKQRGRAILPKLNKWLLVSVGVRTKMHIWTCVRSIPWHILPLCQQRILSSHGSLLKTKQRQIWPRLSVTVRFKDSTRQHLQMHLDHLISGVGRHVSILLLYCRFQLFASSVSAKQFSLSMQGVFLLCMLRYSQAGASWLMANTRILDQD